MNYADVRDKLETVIAVLDKTAGEPYELPRYPGIPGPSPRLGDMRNVDLHNTDVEDIYANVLRRQAEQGVGKLERYHVLNTKPAALPSKTNLAPIQDTVKNIPGIKSKYPDVISAEEFEKSNEWPTTYTPAGKLKPVKKQPQKADQKKYPKKINVQKSGSEINKHSNIKAASEFTMDNEKVRESLAATISSLDKVAYLPPGEEQPGGMPMTPEAMAAPPMDPAMAGGMPPVDPMTGMPMDPAMMGGGMPMPPVDPMTGMPMDPAMMGGTPMSDPAAMGADPMAALAGLMPPEAGGEDPAAATVTIPVDDFRQLIDTVVRMSKEMTTIAGKAADAGSPSPDVDRMANLEEQVSQLTSALGMEAAPAEAAAPAPGATKVASENIAKLNDVLEKLAKTPRVRQPQVPTSPKKHVPPFKGRKFNSPQVAYEEEQKRMAHNKEVSTEKADKAQKKFEAKGNTPLTKVK